MSRSFSVIQVSDLIKLVLVPIADVLSVELWYNITKLVHFKCTENIKKGKQRIIA
jgi:hypothetical protein